jgi:signal transduction histidine kinase
MSWVTVVWSMGASACLTLAVVYLLVWLKNRTSTVHLLFATTAASTAVYAFFELQLMLALTPQALAVALRWAQVPLSVALVSLMWFVAVHLQAGRRRLLWTISGLRVAYVLPNLIWGGNTSLLEIPGLQRIQFLGESVTVIKGAPNPLALLGSFTGLLMLVFVGDACRTAWQRGDRRRVLIIGTSVGLFLSAGIALATLIIWTGMALPIANSLYYQALVGVMGVELSRDLMRATQLAHDLRASESRSAALVRAMPDLMFLQTTDGVYVDYHAPDPSALFLRPDQFLGRNMDDVLPQFLLRAVRPGFEQASHSVVPVVVEYELPMPDGNRRYEARLVRNATDQILTLVRDVTEAARAQAALRESEAVLQATNRQVRELAGRLIESQDMERARIARELHDDLSQQIAGLSIALSALKRRVAPITGAAELPAEIAALQQRAVELAANVRHLSHDLHPSVLAHAGLVAALSAHCADLRRTHGLAVTLTANGDFSAMPTATALCLYRVAQEALRNVVTHAAASDAAVRLVRDGEETELTIVDDGRGFTIGPALRGHGLGLVSINERVRLCGGTVSIVTDVGKGTRIGVRVPAGEQLLSPDVR